MARYKKEGLTFSAFTNAYRTDLQHDNPKPENGICYAEDADYTSAFLMDYFNTMKIQVDPSGRITSDEVKDEEHGTAL